MRYCIIYYLYLYYLFRWPQSSITVDGAVGPIISEARIFGFVARKIASRTDNACHLFAELESGQPATAVVNFVTKVMMGLMQKKMSIDDGKISGNNT